MECSSLLHGLKLHRELVFSVNLFLLISFRINLFRIEFQLLSLGLMYLSEAYKQSLQIKSWACQKMIWAPHSSMLLVGRWKTTVKFYTGRKLYFYWAHQLIRHVLWAPSYDSPGICYRKPTSMTGNQGTPSFRIIIQCDSWIIPLITPSVPFQYWSICSPVPCYYLCILLYKHK